METPNVLHEMTIEEQWRPAWGGYEQIVFECSCGYKRGCVGSTLHELMDIQNQHLASISE